MSQIAEIIEGRPLIHAETFESVREVARRMSNGNVGAVAVLDGGRLVGVFSERDVMSRVVAEGLDQNEAGRNCRLQILVWSPKVGEQTKNTGHRLLLSASREAARRKAPASRWSACTQRGPMDASGGICL